MRAIIAAALGIVMAAPFAAQKSEGPADFVKDSVIHVDGQPVVAGPKRSFKGVKSMAGAADRADQEHRPADQVAL